MFDKQVYIDRRTELKKNFKTGVILFLGNDESAMNYPAIHMLLDRIAHFFTTSDLMYQT